MFLRIFSHLLILSLTFFAFECRDRRDFQPHTKTDGDGSYNNPDVDAAEGKSKLSLIGKEKILDLQTTF